MKTKPGLLKTSGCFAVLLFLSSFLIDPDLPCNTGHDKNCSAGFPFQLRISGFSLSGHVCGESKVKNIPQVNFRVKAEDSSRTIN